MVGGHETPHRILMRTRGSTNSNPIQTDAGALLTHVFVGGHGGHEDSSWIETGGKADQSFGDPALTPNLTLLARKPTKCKMEVK